jgi:hypothetical protein
MQEFDFNGFINHLLENPLELTPVFYFTAGVFLLLVIVYLVRKYLPSDLPEQEEPREEEKATVEIHAEPKPSPAPSAPKLAQTLEMPTAPLAALKPPATQPMGAHIPQDSVLKRHYLAHVRYMLETLSPPRPTDSVLRRHHEQLISSQFEACLRDPARMDQVRADYEARRAEQHRLASAATPAAPAVAKAPPAPPAVQPAAKAPEPAAPAAWIPQDSVLRRHYLNHVLHMVETVAPPRPADSVLRRHHQHLIQSGYEACLRDPARMNQLREDYAACRATQAARPPSVAAATRPAAPSPAAAPSAWIPQDSVLRRHYLSHLLYMLKATAPPRPADSVLRRHYEQLTRSRYEACLRDPARMDALRSDYAARRAAKAA